MTDVIYTQVQEKVQTAKSKKRLVCVSGMLKKIGVSRSGYHAWKKRSTSKSRINQEQMKRKIREIYDASNQNYGAPKITKRLHQAGEKIAERTVGKYMKEMGIKAQWIKPWIRTTKDADFSHKLKNILCGQFNPERPNAVWCSDITYIWTTDGFVYLTSIMDLYSRKIIAWNLSKTLEVSCVIAAIQKAKSRRDICLPLVIHSDRGSNYVSKEYKKATQNMQKSYSKKAYPWDNACIESFHALIKREWLYRFKIKDYDHAYQLVFEYLETFYNTIRIHSHCDYLSPNDFEKQFLKSALEKTQQTG